MCISGEVDYKIVHICRWTIFLHIFSLFVLRLNDLSLVITPLNSSNCGQLTSQIEIALIRNERNELFSINLHGEWAIIGFLPNVLAGEWQGCQVLCMCACWGWRGSWKPLFSIRRDLHAAKQGIWGVFCQGKTTFPLSCLSSSSYYFSLPNTFFLQLTITDLMTAPTVHLHGAFLVQWQ